VNGNAFDVIVIGAGPAGEVLAGRVADQGRRVAMVESALVGGDCAYFACMPSKALLRPADALAEVCRVPGAAQAVTSGLDVEATLVRRDQVVHNWDDSAQLRWLEDNGIKLVRGHGRIDGERRVRVGDRLYEARDAVVVAVGSSATIPPIPGLREAEPWTNREITSSREVPPALTVLGGGVVGVEMAQAYSTLGSSVAIIESATHLIAEEEPFAGDQLLAALLERGVDVHVGVDALAVRRDGENVCVDLSDGQRVEGNEIVVAVGRRPRTDDLGLDTILRVPGLPWLYAIGDVNGRSLLTHMGKYQARVAAEGIAGRHARATRDDRCAPRVVFTDPRVAAVGLTLQAARDSGLNATAYDAPSSGTAGASFHGRDTAGTSRIVVDEDQAIVVGATFTGTDVDEWLHAATIAIVGEVPMERLWEAVPAFPTRSEIWLDLLERREAEQRRSHDA